MIADGNVLASVPIFPGERERLVPQHFPEKALGGVEVALCGEQKVNRILTIVDGAVQIAPLAAYLDIGLVDPNRATMRSAELAHWLASPRSAPY